MAANSFLIFKNNKELFAIPVGKVHSILEIPRITNLPEAPDFLIGVISFRDSVLPVIDFNIKFFMIHTQIKKESCIIVTDILIEQTALLIGILVDEVIEVNEIMNSQILDSPSIGSIYKSQFIEGMMQRDNGFIQFVNIDKVFSISEVSDIQQANPNNNLI